MLLLALGQAAQPRVEKPWALIEAEWVTPQGLFKLDLANVECGMRKMNEGHSITPLL